MFPNSSSNRSSTSSSNSSPSYILYDYRPSGNGYKVRLLLTQLGLTYKYVEKDILRGETRTPEFLQINPNGRIPVLELQPGVFLAESNAMQFKLG